MAAAAAQDARDAVARSTRPSAAQWKAEQTAQVEAERQARREAAARLTPVTDAEIARYGAARQPEAGGRAGGEDRAAVLEEIRAEVGAISAKVGPAGRAGRRAGRRAAR